MRKKNEKKKNRMSLLQLCVQPLSFKDAKRKKMLCLEKKKENKPTKPSIISGNYTETKQNAKC